MIGRVAENGDLSAGQSAPKSLERMGLALAPILFGSLAVSLGQDANWDLLNYHYYNGWAFWNGRINIDLIPAQTPTFINPTLDAGFYLLTEWLPPRAVGFLLGALHGLNFILLYWLAAATLRNGDRSQRLLLRTTIALAGALGGGALGELGTTFYDNIISLALLASLLIFAQDAGARRAGPVSFSSESLSVGGAILGIAVGVKLTASIYMLAVMIGLMSVPAPLVVRLRNVVVFGLSATCAVVLVSGHWLWTMWEKFQNPLFPYFNNIFDSPFEEKESYRDTQFIPEGFLENLLFPYDFTFDPYAVGEVYFRDIRILLLFMAVPVACACALRRHFSVTDPASRPAVRSEHARLLLATAVAAYIGWLLLFCVYRYLIPLEMLAPLVLAVAFDQLPLRRVMRMWGLVAALCLSLTTSAPADWGRVRWGGDFTGVQPPPIKNAADTMVLMTGLAPTSFVIPAFPHQLRWVRIQSNFVGPEEVDHPFNTLLRDETRRHAGAFLVLFDPAEAHMTSSALAMYGFALVHESCRGTPSRLWRTLQLCAVLRI